MNKIDEKGSTTIPCGSRVGFVENHLEKVALFHFYVLIDPIDGLIKYVGRTVNPAGRLRNHIYESKKRNRNRRERWIVSLLNKNEEPIIFVFFSSELTLDKAIKMERFFVNYFSKEFDLKNMPDNYLGAVLTGKKVYQYSRETRTLISEYANSNQAYLKTGVKDSNILRCCNSPNGYGTKSAGGFFWSFDKYEKYPYEYDFNWKPKGKVVFQFSLEGEFIKEYITAREASRETGISYKAISSVCTKKQKQAGGFIWRFER